MLAQMSLTGDIISMIETEFIIVERLGSRLLHLLQQMTAEIRVQGS